MRKIVMSLAIIIVLLLPVTAQAANGRTINVIPKLTFSGTTANCSLTVLADSMSDEIEATIKLWHGSTCIVIWQEDSTGILSFKDTVSTSKGKTYELTADVTINGVTQPQASVSAKCE